MALERTWELDSAGARTLDRRPAVRRPRPPRALRRPRLVHRLRLGDGQLRRCRRPPSFAEKAMASSTGDGASSTTSSPPWTSSSSASRRAAPARFETNERGRARVHRRRRARHDRAPRPGRHHRSRRARACMREETSGRDASRSGRHSRRRPASSSSTPTAPSTRPTCRRRAPLVARVHEGRIARLYLTCGGNWDGETQQQRARAPPASSAHAWSGAGRDRARRGRRPDHVAGGHRGGRRADGAPLRGAPRRHGARDRAPRLTARAVRRAGPARSPPTELATATGIDDRYAREWLEQQAISGLVDVRRAR